MDKKVKSALDNLIEEIKLSKEFKEFMLAKTSWVNSKESQKLLDDYLETRQTVQVFKQGNFPGLEEKQEQLKSLYQKVNKDKNIEAWMNAQDEYQEFIWEQAEYLSAVTELAFAPKPRGGCCG